VIGPWPRSWPGLIARFSVFSCVSRGSWRLLRHRARRVIVVCPASLTLKWQEEMEAKFGLGFQILDTAQLRELRRSHGLEANPFAVYPRTIISLQWLRTPRVQRMLDEVLTNDTRFPGFFDLLIVDEVHHCAPPKEHGYPVESKQTSAARQPTASAPPSPAASSSPHHHPPAPPRPRTPGTLACPGEIMTADPAGAQKLVCAGRPRYLP
jgi:hypothetical protein